MMLGVSGNLNLGTTEALVPLRPEQDYLGGVQTPMSMELEFEGVALSLSLGPAPADATVICYNCDKPGHYIIACPGPRKGGLKEIAKEGLVVETDEQESKKEEAWPGLRRCTEVVENANWP
jgi:Zinc knuckle